MVHKNVGDVFANAKLMANYGKPGAEKLASAKLQIAASGDVKSKEADAIRIVESMHGALQPGAEIPPLVLVVEVHGSAEALVFPLPEGTFPTVHRESNRIRLFKASPVQ